MGDTEEDLGVREGFEEEEVAREGLEEEVTRLEVAVKFEAEERGRSSVEDIRKVVVVTLAVTFTNGIKNRDKFNAELLATNK